MPEPVQAIEGVPFAFAAAIAPTLGGELETTTVRAVRHGPDAISVELEAVCSVGVTFWSSGETEMTWHETEDADEAQIQQYQISSLAALNQFLYDLRVRLHG